MKSWTAEVPRPPVPSIPRARSRPAAPGAAGLPRPRIPPAPSFPGVSGPGSLTGHAAVHGGGLLCRYHVVVRHVEGLRRPVGTRPQRQRDGHQRRDRVPDPRGELHCRCLRPADTLQPRAAETRGITGRPHLASWRTHGSRGSQPKEAPPRRPRPVVYSYSPEYPDEGAC